MDEKIKNLWNNNRLLFWILLPLIILAFAGFFLRDIIFAMLAGSARKVSEEAKKKDEDLKNQANAAQVAASATKAEADALAKKISERSEKDVDEDWNKKS